jgi:hypothetical protein
VLQISDYGGGGTALHAAADHGHTHLLEFLWSQGLDVNEPSKKYASRPLHEACANGHIDAALWLLEHGADVDAGQREGAPTPLIIPVNEGRIGIVRLLLAHGADVNACYRGTDGRMRCALGFAVERGHTEIEKLLREHGARDLRDAGLPAEDSANLPDAVAAHLAEAIGPVDPAAQLEIVPGGLPIAIHRIPAGRRRDYVTLFTSGLSAAPLEIPEAVAVPPRAELVMRLPADWPADPATLTQPRFHWPYRWLRDLARELNHVGQQVPGWTIVSNGEPAEPIAPGTRLSCFLLVYSEELGVLRTGEGDVGFVDVLPIHSGERQLALNRGLESLLELFARHQVSASVDLVRPDVTTL